MIDTVNGANSSAIIYSIAETAKANNLKPFDYFEYLLTEIPKHVDDKTQIFLQNFCHGQICCPKTLESRKKPAENKQTAKAVCYCQGARILPFTFWSALDIGMTG